MCVDVRVGRCECVRIALFRKMLMLCKYYLYYVYWCSMLACQHLLMHNIPQSAAEADKYFIVNQRIWQIVILILKVRRSPKLLHLHLSGPLRQSQSSLKIPPLIAWQLSSVIHCQWLFSNDMSKSIQSTDFSSLSQYDCIIGLGRICR